MTFQSRRECAVSMLLLLLVYLCSSDAGEVKSPKDSSSREPAKMAEKAAAVNRCRQFPTWKRGTDEEADFQNCTKIMGYDIGVEYLMDGATEDFVENKDWAVPLRKCMEEKYTPPEETEYTEPEIVNFYPSKQNAVMATVAFTLAEHEAMAVQALSQCVKEVHPDNYDKRSFYQGYDEEEDKEKYTPEERGGNDVVFLAGFLQILLPGVASQIYSVAHLVWEQADWGKEPVSDEFDPYPNPYECGIHTTEHLDYTGWAKLGSHADSESVYTVLVSLSDPDEYEGGEFFVLPTEYDEDDSARIVLKPQKYSAVVFQSDEEHGVQKILDGRRQMFTTELWDLDDVSLGHHRPLREDFEEEMYAPDDDDDEVEDETKDEL